MSNVVIAFLGIVGTLAGAYFGHRWSEDAELRRERQLQASARLLVKLEINHNLRALQKYWSDVKEIAIPDHIDQKSPDRREAYLAILYSRRLVSLVPPDWTVHAFQSQLGILAQALSAPEIESVNNIYSGLDQVTSTRSHLLGPSAEPTRFEPISDLVRGTTYHHPVPPTTFDDMAPSAWSLVDSTVEALLITGNPLGQQLRRS